MNNPFLVGKKIYLRSIVETDLNDSYQQWFNDDEVCQFNSHHRFPNYRQNMEKYYNEVIKSQDNLVLAIIDKDTDQHIGNIALQNINKIDNSAELTIIIGDKNFWGSGIGKEATRLIIQHGFDSLNLHRIYCGTLKENIGMQKLAESLGFKQEGIRRESLYKNGSYKDGIEYGLLYDEFEKK